MFWILGNVLDSGKCFGFWDVVWILGSVLYFGKCFWILGNVLDSGKCFWILGSVLSIACRLSGNILDKFFCFLFGKTLCFPL